MASDILLFFATDIHGSEACFRKWLNAADGYGADVLVMGGDLTGKVVVPFHRRNGSWLARWRDDEVRLESRDEVAAFCRRVADAGAYAWESEPQEAENALADEDAAERLFSRLAAERVAKWVELAEERLAARAGRAFIIAGNDDPPEVDAALRHARALVHCDRRVVWIEDWLPMLSLGDSTPTPWNSPRELPEEEYEQVLAALLEQLGDPGRAVFNLHMPPFGSNLDLAPELDAELRVRYSAVGEMRQAPVGGRAVRAAIERHQPLLGLHGHVHESRGRAKIGRTLCFNPGSDYVQGVLRGVLVRVSAKRGVRDYVFTAG
jgi:Icc-related predicted phosphoesterase